MNTTGRGFTQPIPDVLLQQIIKLDQIFFPKPWAADEWKNVNYNNTLVIGWEKESNPVGFALFGTSPGDETAHLYKILVHPSHQGTAVTQEFWSYILAKLRQRNFKSIFLEVEDDNLRAIRFYSKVGFATLRQIKNYYSNGGGAYTMQLML